ncbi:DUF721 domain-containing protein [Kozakia baliensis]|uniref:Uncharacterized protein n=1 Tax=Kozakia baliensis TaxID=153496 RepID=A0A1D8UWE2_9PROT|nr:DUF721 domain-containing protein [Kozakia baliensis]AOX17827.1 hypothetical protein A0U89_12520 [Kozakia baliensis]GBR33577.1 hypothetical protein AA0488_2736 [Kozakia baliensis NRIC 0488]GEL64911.1 hypothetical protein KBA01_21970 [Kozakia baliensis]
MTKDEPRGKSVRRAKTAAQEQNWESRSFVARSIGTIIPKVTQPVFRKHTAPAIRLILDWPEIVGPYLARETEPRRLSAGTLTIACSGPMAMELQHLAPQLIERINTHCGPLRKGRDLRFGEGPELVKRLRIVQDASVVSERPVTRPTPTAVDVPGVEQEGLRDVLGRLGGHIAERSRSRRRF